MRLAPVVSSWSSFLLVLCFVRPFVFLRGDAEVGAAWTDCHDWTWLTCEHSRKVSTTLGGTSSFMAVANVHSCPRTMSCIWRENTNIVTVVVVWWREYIIQSFRSNTYLVNTWLEARKCAGWTLHTKTSQTESMNHPPHPQAIVFVWTRGRVF